MKDSLEDLADNPGGEFQEYLGDHLRGQSLQDLGNHENEEETDRTLLMRDAWLKTGTVVSSLCVCLLIILKV